MTPIRRSQLYAFLSSGFLYPLENWLDDRPDLSLILVDLGLGEVEIPSWRLELPGLQAAHRHALGLTGSLCYETEYGLPNEYRQSYELADIAGFYRAFGFTVGGKQRERPDHLSMQLEFMYVLTLMEAYALEQANAERVEICQQAQGRFLQDHLGRWIGLFAASLARSGGDSTTPENPYLWLARLAERFVRLEAQKLGITLQGSALADVQHTPVITDISCGDCPLA